MGIRKRRNNGNKNHLLVRLRRRLKLFYLKIMRIDDPPERIARGAAIGILMGVLPTFGLGSILSLGFAFLLKANKASAVIGSLIMNPLTYPFFWTASAVVGAVLLQEDSSAILTRVRNGSLASGVGWVYLVFATGNVVVSAVTSIGGYYLVKNAVIKHRKRKAEKRRAREAS